MVSMAASVGEESTAEGRRQRVDEPEPNGWELMRGIKELKASIDGLAAGMVTQSMFDLYRAGVELAQAAVIKRVETLEEKREEERKTKAQQWFAIGLALLGAVASLVTGLILWALSAR